MRDLHVVSVAEGGTSIVLADAGGAQYALAVNDRLLAALRGEHPNAGQLEIAMTSQLSPRDIQQRVRAGASVEEISAHAGVGVDRVLRFAAPVLDERAHVATRGRRALLRSDGMLELGTVDEVTTATLDRRGATQTLRWDAWRREDGRWLLACRWLDDHQEHTALWALDSTGGSATPLDDDARALAGLEPSEPEPVRLAVVPTPRGTHQDDDEQPTGENPTVAEDETPTGPIPTVDAHAPAGTPGPRHPARRARARQPESDEGRLWLSEIAENVEEGPAATPAPDSSRRQRPPVPSWDEIMFGRRS
jgi:hypothetical protein